MLTNLKQLKNSAELSKSEQCGINGGKIVEVCKPWMNGWPCARPDGTLGQCGGTTCY